MHDSDLPDGILAEEREVTLLFADLRGVTELAGSLEMDPLFCELLAQVLDCLTEAVVEHHGFVVDYFGDGLMAMWNAPADQPDHAELACRAGLEMLATLPEVSADWVRLIQTELRAGIGIHTGMVQVGNAGSTKQVKYGARGPNVHLASRVEAATKELLVPLLVTQATVEQLPESLVAHRVCRAWLPGARLPVDLYAVRLRQSDATHARGWQTYESALRQFEAGKFQDAADTLAHLIEAAADIPAKFLTDCIQRELSSNLRRRSTDKPAVHPGGVVTLSTK
jgi:adenylate cyclase